MRITAILFFLLLFADLLAIRLGYSELHIWLKPLLMPVLLVLVSMQLYVDPHMIRKLLLTGLFFAWSGDILLLFETHNPAFFLAGLGSFLCTHICYILMFLQIKSRFTGTKQYPWWIFAVVIVYGIGLLGILWPNLADLKIPVLVYAVCICTMAMLSVSATQNVNKYSRTLLIAGAFLFVISDSILAINKFLGAGSWAAWAIMLTYGLAQLAIVAGVSNLLKETSGGVLEPEV